MEISIISQNVAFQSAYVGRIKSVVMQKMNFTWHAK